MNKLLCDIIPAILFFLAYKLFNVYVATGVAIVSTALIVLFLWVKQRHVDKMLLFVLVLLVVMGGFTILFHKAIFIQWKVSVIYWLFAAILFFTQYFGRKQPILRRLLGDKIMLPDAIWARLNIAWGVFFTLMGCVNLYVAYQFSLNDWVNFKLFGTLGATVLFVVLQSIYMYRHMEKLS